MFKHNILKQNSFQKLILISQGKIPNDHQKHTVD